LSRRGGPPFAPPAGGPGAARAARPRPAGGPPRRRCHRRARPGGPRREQVEEHGGVVPPFEPGGGLGQQRQQRAARLVVGKPSEAVGRHGVEGRTGRGVADLGQDDGDHRRHPRRPRPVLLGHAPEPRQHLRRAAALADDEQLLEGVDLVDVGVAQPAALAAKGLGGGVGPLEVAVEQGDHGVPHGEVPEVERLAPAPDAIAELDEQRVGVVTTTRGEEVDEQGPGGLDPDLAVAGTVGGVDGLDRVGQPRRQSLGRQLGRPPGQQRVGRRAGVADGAGQRDGVASGDPAGLAIGAVRAGPSERRQHAHPAGRELLAERGRRPLEAGDRRVG
jgi:hypothetical protein